MSTLTVRNLFKEYGAERTLDNINLEVEKGEFVVIVGPSGCGKTTLLRIVAGLETATTGVVLIDDKIMNDVQPKDRHIAMVFQNYALYPHMSVYQNMAYGLKMRGVKKNIIRERIDSIAKKLQLADNLQKKPGTLSGGQKQRVAIGRALVRKPSLFLFDEPLSNLDAKLRQDMRLEIKRLHQEFNVTSLYVTHDQVEAMTLADKVVVMNGGQIEQIGTPLELYHNPKTEFVASFIGSPAMNIMPVSNNDKLQKYVQVIQKVKKLNMGNTKLNLGIRPEAIEISRESKEDNFCASVSLVECLGAESIIHIDCEISQLPILVKSNMQHMPYVGQSLYVSFPPQSCHLFEQI